MSARKIICFTLCGLIFQPSMAQQYYKWVDSKGVTNYSARPPASKVKKKNISTISTYADGSRDPTPSYRYQSNASIPDTQHNYYNNNASSQQYRAPAQPQRSAEDEALRQKIIKEASTPLQGSRGLTANQRNILAAQNGTSVPSGNRNSNSNNPYSAPMPPRPPSNITNCDSAGCLGSDGTRYNRGAGDTYFPSTGGVCQGVGGQMNCN